MYGKVCNSAQRIRNVILDYFIVQILFLIMKDVGADFTMTFRELCDWDLADMRKTPEHIPEEVRFCCS